MIAYEATPNATEVYLVDELTRTVTKVPRATAMKHNRASITPMTKCVDFDWKVIEDVIGNIVDMVKDNLHSGKTSLPIEGVTCPPGRGGLVPASILAYRLNVPFISFDALRSKTWPNPRLPSTILVIDDIFDSGKTATLTRKQLLASQGHNYTFEFYYLFSRWFTPTFGTAAFPLHSSEYCYFPWDPRP